MPKAIDDKLQLEYETSGHVSVDGFRYEPHEYSQSVIALQVAILKELRDLIFYKKEEYEKQNQR